jgi:hypothetical protein
MKYNVPLELQDVFGSPNDDEVSADVPDVFAKFVEEAALGAGLGNGNVGRQHVSALAEEAQEREAKLASHYQKIAATAQTKPAGGMKPAAPAPEHLYDALLRAERAAPLGKSEMTSRLLRLSGELRPHCVGEESALLEKAAKALDVTAFAEIAESIVRRVRK